MPTTRHKVLAYVTNGGRLLVFRHPEAPEAGIQVPAGTVRPGETPAAAALREAAEETGLSGLRLAGHLGMQVRDMADVGRAEVHRRDFYHVICPGVPPDGWRHWETDPVDGGAPIPFEFFWARLPVGVPPLIADHGYSLPQLIAARGQPG